MGLAGTPIITTAYLGLELKLPEMDASRLMAPETVAAQETPEDVKNAVDTKKVLTQMAETVAENNKNGGSATNSSLDAVYLNAHSKGEDVGGVVEEEDRFWFANQNLLFSIKENTGLEETKEALSEGANVNEIDSHGLRPIHWAAKRPVEYTKLLQQQPNLELNAGTAGPTDPRTALQFSVAGSNMDVFKALKTDPRLDKEKNNYSGLLLRFPYYADENSGKARATDIAMMKLLLADPEINVNAADPRGTTPLHLAVLAKNVAAVEMLLAHPNINPHLKNKGGKAPIDLIPGNSKNRVQLYIKNLLAGELQTK